MAYLLDTNHCVAYLRSNVRGHAQVKARIDAVAAGEILISHFTVMELYEGPWLAQTSQQQAREEQDLATFLTSIPTVPLTSLDTRTYGCVKAYLRKRGQLIGDLDIAIAAVAVTHDLTLVTNDNGFQRLVAPFGLKLDNWIP